MTGGCIASRKKGLFYGEQSRIDSRVDFISRNRQTPQVEAKKWLVSHTGMPALFAFRPSSEKHYQNTDAQNQQNGQNQDGYRNPDLCASGCVWLRCSFGVRNRF